MKLRLERQIRSPDSTIGVLYIDDQRQCYILEDTIREIPGRPTAEWKVYGKTAIPYGTYEVIINMSARFKRRLPLLVNVPGFDGIRIHPGNTAADTDGCLLPGTTKGPNVVNNSRVAFDALFARLDAALAAGEKVTIAIVRGPEA